MHVDLSDSFKYRVLYYMLSLLMHGFIRCNCSFVYSYCILHHLYLNSIQIPLDRARSFGYEKQDSLYPPTCLISVYGDKSVEGCKNRLLCPVQLKGASFREGDSSAEFQIIILLRDASSWPLSKSNHKSTLKSYFYTIINRKC